MINIANLQVEVDGNSYTTPALFNWSEADTHQINALSPQPAGSSIRYTFNSWNNNGNQQQSITVPDQDSTFTATYFREYELTTSVNPGSGGSVNISPSQNWFKQDSLAILLAVADTNYTFSGWSGDLSGSKNPDTLIMDNPKTVTANFNFINSVNEEIQNPIPRKFALKQNYPNPFNPITMINYQLPINSAVNLSIYNILGKRVATLVNKGQSAGYYQVRWDATGFAVGVYFYHLETDNNFSDTKKLLLLK